jgi:hypothetical protein
MASATEEDDEVEAEGERELLSDHIQRAKIPVCLRIHLRYYLENLNESGQ